jgi:hypothetical protein
MKLNWESGAGNAGLYKVLRGGLGFGGVEGDARARLRDARLAWGLPDGVWCRADAPCYGVALPSQLRRLDWRSELERRAGFVPDVVVREAIR